MNSLLVVLLVAASAGFRPTVAIVPPAAIEGSDTWLGLAVADNLSTGLLRYSRRDKKTKRDTYPINVFSWRQTLSAARAEAIDTSEPLSGEAVHKLAKQLGAKYLFTGSYRIKQGKKPKVLLKWRLIDIDSRRKPKLRRVTTNLKTLSARNDKMVSAVLQALGERKGNAAAFGSKPGVPFKAIKAHAMGLEILAQQSLDPRAHVVLPAIELKKAHFLFESATQQTPEFLRAWVGRGLASAMLGELQRAEKEMLHALANSKELEPLSTLGLYYLYVRNNKRNEAINTLSKATAKHTGFLDALGYLGSAYLREGQAKKAETVFAVYKQRVPQSPWARVMHARATAYQGQHDKAIAETQAVFAEFPDSAMVLARLAARQAQARRNNKALETLKHGLAKHPNNPLLLTLLSYVKLQLGIPKEAVALAERALARLGNGRGELTAGHAHANHGHALARLGKKKEALAAFAEAARFGIGVEARRRLLEDKKIGAIMKDPNNPLAADAPGSSSRPPTPPTPPTAKSSGQKKATGEHISKEEDWEDEEDWQEDWEEDGEWSEGDEWDDEEYEECTDDDDEDCYEYDDDEEDQEDEEEEQQQGAR